ncbi:sensor histidine kinase [Calidifontibacter terrae]
MTWSIRQRVLTLTTLAGLIVATLGVGLFALLLHTVLSNSVTDASRAQTARVASAIATSDESIAQVIEGVPAQGMLIQILDASGKVIAYSDPDAARPFPHPTAPSGQVSVQKYDSIGPSTEGKYSVATELVVTTTGDPVRVVVAATLEPASDSMHTAVAILAAAGFVLLAGFVYLVSRAVRSALRPVDDVRREVDRIEQAGSDRRVTVPPTKDELARLATTMNHMLDRLETSDRAIRRFVSDASHELRSPIATLRVTLETMPDDDAEMRRRLPVLLSETLRLHRLVDDLLTLAKTDDHGFALSYGEVDLDELFAAEVARLRATGSVTVVPQFEAVRIEGDAPRIAQVLRNLVDNARGHAATTVRLGCRQDGDHALLWVENDGPPISPADREQIFNRFVRLDDSRARANPREGSGLGLPISRAMVERHGGSIAVVDGEAGWTRFAVALPLRREQTRRVQLRRDQSSSL